MRIGFTTSLPVEVIFAAGHTPVDLNNVFINTHPSKLVKNAELFGFPRNICAWIKGMYAAIKEQKIDMVIGIVQGDCSNTHSLMSILQDEGVAVLPFSYPWDRDAATLEKEIIRFEKYFGVSRKQTNSIKLQLDKIREKLILLDKMTYQTNQVTSAENHTWLVNSTDFNGDFSVYESDLDRFLELAGRRESSQSAVRLGFVGVPPIIENIYSFIEENSARVVYNEVQRQFSMYYLERDIVAQYLRFTYPYDIFTRIEDIRLAIVERKIDGLICYTQSFCHRQLDFISLKKHIDIPMIQIEGDQPSRIDSRTKLRIESFIEMLHG
ncbi:MAG: 2-hydroxyacyl-CoA dehydratase [Candidatus Cloacimonetes bacterium]|nr:2-hydroxyacyl-CoA dehydratase [Candidatus Cloacimonadota bacterium]